MRNREVHASPNVHQNYYNNKIDTRMFILMQHFKFVLIPPEITQINKNIYIPH
jgi:hypothetical protein